MGNFYDTIRNSPYFGHDTICKDVNMLEPGTRAAVLDLMADAKSQGIDLRVLETYRSQTRQSALFAKRATQLRTVGCHGYGVACDFGVFVNNTYQPASIGATRPRRASKTATTCSAFRCGASRRCSAVRGTHPRPAMTRTRTALRTTT